LVSPLLNSKKVFLFTLILLVQGVFYLKFLALPLVVLILFNNGLSQKIKFDSISIFYCLIIFIGSLSYFIEIFRSGFQVRGALLVLFSLGMWLFYLIIYLMLKGWSYNREWNELEWVLESFFKINVIVCLFQYFLILFSYKVFNPFASELATSAGDNFKGLFANSSVNMVVCAFYSIYFLIKNNIKFFGISILIILFTSYMSGVLIYFFAFGLFFLFSNKVNFKLKLVSLSLFGILGLVLFLISYDNIIYAYTIIESVFTLSPPRKVVSFAQTVDFLKSDVLTFLFGASPAHFSSRFAFIGGGEFVNWYPSFLTFRSGAFNVNHFQLWNNEVLSIPFNDGTGNQPFSVYNQIFGEYGLIGFLCLIAFYLNGVWNRLRGSSYVFLILISLLLFFLLDYWFEYLATMIMFELLIIGIDRYRISKLDHRF